jgi:hypothetical protein
MSWTSRRLPTSAPLEAGAHHDRGSGLDGVPDAEHVDLNLVAERLLLAGVLGHHPDARVGQHDIHRTEVRDTAGHSGPQRGHGPHLYDGRQVRNSSP